MDILMEWVATDAFHDSRELYDDPKCHPHTRAAVLDDIMKWVESEFAQDEFMLWLFGPAGAGKSAIAKRIAEIAAERELLVGDFFFSKSSRSRNSSDRLIATLAYQLAVSIAETRAYIEDAIERDPAIFHKNVQTQIDTLLIKPFQSSMSSNQNIPSKKLIIIDGLDECHDTKDQVAILEAISHSFPQHNLPIKFLLVSRPETDLVTSFNCNEPLKFIHRRLALDDTYRPDDDIHLFFSDRFKYIRLTHPLRSTIPNSWPTRKMLKRLVEKASGQFIYASTVVKFVESSRHRPTARLNIILGISSPGTTNPFTELDAFYNHILSSVDDIHITLRVLSLYVMTPEFAQLFCCATRLPEQFLSLEPGDIHLASINLSSILTYHESSGEMEIMHASFVDFLSDKCRSTIYYIDIASTCIDFVRRILQDIKGPDGIQAGDIDLLCQVFYLSPRILKGQQLWNDILNFDIDAFINAFLRWRGPNMNWHRTTIKVFWIWEKFLSYTSMEDTVKREAQNRLKKSFESRLQIYQSNRQFQLLFTFAAANFRYYWSGEVPYYRCVDILLEMDDQDLHLADQNALDLRRPTMTSGFTLSHYVDGDASGSAALHCIRFLSNPPTYSEKAECPEMGLIYEEWKATCEMTLETLCELLRQANISTELVQFFTSHDVHPTVKRYSYADHVLLNVHILAYLSRANVCSNWRIISAIKQRPVITHPSSDEDEEWSSGEDWDVQERETTRHLIWRCLDEGCSIGH